ncbi:MAG: hypothetical protein QOK15_1849 [Nocardioidaceae bacterium]|jgi:uncharacterized membrane protein YkvA (DUF1232 family)|nr:hypothetical protein [Nocardioidaceae bacterium]
MGWHLLAVVVGGLAVIWLALVASLYLVGHREGERANLREAVRLVPDVLRLVRALAGDRTLPRGVRLRLVLLLGYLLLPVDLVPDFIPVVGYADDVLVVVLALRSVVRAAGPEALERHWTGTPDGLRTVRRLVT